MTDERGEGLLAWQWSSYHLAHRSRKNLVIHGLTQPLFVAGLLSLPAAIATTPWLAAGSVLAMGIAAAAQGAGHKREATPPAPFRGPLDVAARLFAEQLVTFPRYVVTGGFARAWREAGETGETVSGTPL